MSEGEILLTNDRMENNIPYISLNSCKDTETFRPANLWGTWTSVLYLVFGDPRLLLAVPLVVIHTAAVAVKDVQVVDGHLQTHTTASFHTQEQLKGALKAVFTQPENISHHRRARLVSGRFDRGGNGVWSTTNTTRGRAFTEKQFVKKTHGIGLNKPGQTFI